MSRAVDSDVKADISNEDRKRIFQRVAAALTPPTEGDLLDIEILGKSHRLEKDSPLIQDGNALGLTKTGLVQAFIAARLIWMKHQEDGSPNNSEETLKATAVLLLLDAEHLAAANTRKRLLTSHTETAKESLMSPSSGQLRQEKLFVDSLLTSRLHRHTKSPNIWSHRRWLLSVFQYCSIPVNLEYELTRVIFVSGERHPRNYYAWMHARWLLNTFPPPTTEGGFKLVTLAQKWCLGHHNDVSGWMFLLYMIEKWPEQVDSVMEQTLGLAERFAWRNESVWYFMRNLCAMKLGEQWCTRVSSAVMDLKLTSQSEVELRVLEATSKRLDTASLGR